MIKCPECNKDISDKASKCVHCGAKLIEEEKKVCEECGNELKKNTKVCPKCGCPVEEKKDKKDSGIKFVAAKCPSCGANIEVNENEKKTKCNFCHSTILVDEAIEKLQIEISGEVEVKNLPKLEGILKVAERHYEDGEYDEALEQYSAAVVLDPNNPLAALRKGICKSLTTNYAKFEIVSALNGFTEAMRLEKDEEKKKQYIMEMTLAASKLEDFAFRFYNKLKYIGNDEITELLVRLNLCSEVYEKIVTYTDDNTIKVLCYKNIANDCTEILRDKYYGTGRYNDGQEIKQKYILKTSFQNEIENKRKKYLQMLEKLDPKLAKELDNKNQKYKIDSVSKPRIWILVLSLIIGYMWGIRDCTLPFFGYLLVINGIILIKPIFKAIYKDKASLGIVISIIVGFVCGYFIFFNLYPAWAVNKYISVSGNETIEFQQKNVKVCKDGTCNDLIETFEHKLDYDIVTIENNKYKYNHHYSEKNKDYLFCQCDENENCIKYFKEEGKEKEYVLNDKEEKAFYQDK